MRKITGLLAASVLFVAACGGDDDDNAAGTQSDNGSATATATGVQNDAADELIKQADDGNLDPDEGCIREKAAKLSDDDAQKIVDADSSDTPDLSPAGFAILGETASCLSGDAMINQLVEGLPEGVDADCVREKLKDVDFGAILETGTRPPAVDQAINDCGTG